MVTDAEITENWETPGEILANIAARSKNDLVLSNIARHRNTPVKTLIRLTKSRINVVAMDAAANRRLSPNILRKLSWSLNRQVQLGICYNPNTPLPILKRFARCGDWRLDRAIALHENADAALLTKIAQRKNSVNEAHLFIGQNPNVDVALLEWLVRNSDGPGRTGVANNPNTPPEILHSLIRDRYDAVQEAAARNKNTPLSDLISLIKGEIDGDYRAQDEAEATFLELPEAKVEEYFKDLIDPVPTRSWLLKLIKDNIL